MTTAVFSQNYFELFGLPESYDIDLTELANRYRTLQNAVHPDKFASASDQERRLSVQQSALINEAFQTLKHPLSRAQYMLRLIGVDIDGDTSTQMAPEFLMQQMHLREELEQIRQSKDPASGVLAISAEIEQAILGQMTILKKLFENKEQTDVRQLTDHVRRMQFMFKLQQEIDVLEEDIF